MGFVGVQLYDGFPNLMYLERRKSNFYVKGERRFGGLTVRVPASRSPVPGSNLGHGGASPAECGLWGGSSHCNSVLMT